MELEEYIIKNNENIFKLKKKLNSIIKPPPQKKISYIENMNIILNKITEKNKYDIYNDFFFNFNKNHDMIMIIDNIIKKGIMNEKYINIYIELLIKINDKINIKDIIKNYIINYDIKLDNNKLDYEGLCIYNKKKIRINNYMIIISKLIKVNLLEKYILDHYIDDMILSIENYYDILYNIANDNINNINNNQKEKIINIKNNIKILKIKFKLMDLLDL